MLVDTHCHLASRRFSADVSEVIARARDSGVTRMIAIGTNPEDSREVIELAEKFEGVFAAVGVHPCDVCEVTANRWFEAIENLSTHPKVVAIGETGLDFFHPPPVGVSVQEHRAIQAEFFRRQLELAAERGLPVVVHQRGEGCWPASLEVTRPFAGRVRAVFHCYVGDERGARDALALGHLVSFTGVVTYPNAPTAADCASSLDAGSFMIETDAPYLAPVPHRGKRCEPAFVAATAAFIARRRDEQPERLAEHTTQTAIRFFNLPA